MVLITKELKGSKWKFIIFGGLLLVLSVTIVIQYPFVKNLLNQGILEGMPEWMVKGAVEQTNFSVFLAANWYDKNLIQIATIFAILLGMSVVSSEVEDHTIEFLLSRPISRSSLFLQKTIIQILVSLIIIITTTIILGITALIQNYEVNFGRLILGITPIFAKFLIFYSLALLISLFIDDQVKSGLLTGVLLIITWGIAAIWNISSMNIFAYTPVTPYYVHGVLPYIGIFKLFLVAFIFYGLAWYKFKLKDF